MKIFNKKYIVLFCFFFWTCEDKVSVSNLDSIQIISTNDVLMPGQSTYFYARGFDKEGNRLDKLSVTWESSNEAIAFINNEGKITAKSKGVTKISATSSEISASFDIIVSITKKRVLSEMFTSST